MKNWYSVKNQAENVEISIYDEIGMWGVTAKDFITDMRSLQGDQINLAINSPGGSVFDAIAIYNALRSSGKTVNVKVMGVAASAASLIAMAGDKITMPENTFLMIHNPWSFAMGNADELREMADVLDKIAGSLVATYVKRSGKDEQEVRDLLAAETWMTASEAVEMGFADEMIPALSVKASFEIERLPENVRAAFEGVEPVKAPEAPQPQTAFADQVFAKAEAAGFGDFSALWALHCKDMGEVSAAITDAVEIKALCAVAKKPEMASGFIAQRKTVAQAREALCSLLAEQDESTHVDTTQRNQASTEVKKQQELKPSDVWNARRKGAIK